MINSFSFELTMIRHGQTDANGNTYQGEIDFDLNANGISQMAAAAELVKGIKEKRVGALFRSYMMRAVHSAEIINKSLNLNVVEIREMREFKIGILQGKTKEAYKEMLDRAKTKGVYETLEQKHAFVIEGGLVDGQDIAGESVNMVFQRAITSLTAIAEYAKAHQDEGEAAIVHEWWTRCLLAKKYGLDKDQIKIENGGIISLVVTLDLSKKEGDQLSYGFNINKCKKCYIDSVELSEWVKKITS